MKISYHDYDLIYNSSRKKHSGALLKIAYEDGLIGYCDCHPWVEIGDEPLNEQKSLLKEGLTSPLLNRSLYMARLDAQARNYKKSLFEGLNFPKSHFLIPDVNQISGIDLPSFKKMGFDTLKIKLGNSLKLELAPLLTFCENNPNNFKLRLDFNQKLNHSQFLDFLRIIEKYISQIEFCEDPFPFDRFAWADIQANYPLALACDYQAYQAYNLPESAKFLVIKPAIENAAFFLNCENSQQLVFTSYLDHPIGQIGAAYVAAIALKKHPHKLAQAGLCSHLAYHTSVFSQHFNQTSQITAPNGTGIGFDELLNNLEWNVLNEYELAIR